METSLTAQEYGMILGCKVEYCQPEGCPFLGTLIGVTIDEELIRLRIKPDEDDEPELDLESEFVEIVLRRLETLTEEEENYSMEVNLKLIQKYDTMTPKAFQYLLSLHMDLFGWIDAGLAIDVTIK